MMNRPKTIASLNKRERARYLAACDRYQAEKQKPPTRSQAQAWLAPIRKAFNEMQAEGRVDKHEPAQRGAGFHLTWARRETA